MTKTASVSRRSFVKLAMGTLAILPVAEGGFLLPGAAPTAHADDDAADQVRIMVVTPKQVGLYVSDQADGKDAPVEGANVVITSRYNGAVVTAQTNDEGVAVVDIEGLAEPRDELGRYAFNGTIDVVADGYREFHMALARVIGGVALEVPTRALESGCPYPSTVAFAEWDALYTKNAFVSTSGNDGAKALDVTVKNLDESATLTLLERNSSITYASAALVPSDGVATAAIEKEFLLKGSADALPVGGDFYMQIETASAVFEFPIALEVMEGVANALSIEPYQDLSPINSPIPSTPSINVPDYIPAIGGQSLSMWLPTWSIVPVIDPFGFLYIAWQSPRVGYTNDSGSANPGKWGVHPYASASDQWTNYKDTSITSSNNVFDAITKGSYASHIKWTSIITAAASFRFAAAAKWDWSTRVFQGDAEALGLLEFNINCTERFTLGPVPFFVSFGFNSNIAIQLLGMGFATPDALAFSKYSWDYTNRAASVTINFSPFLSLGVGISGVASIAIKGACTACFFVGLNRPPDPTIEGAHIIFGANGAATVEVQLFLFKWSGKIWSFNEPKIKDSWNKSLETQSNAEAPSVPDDYTLKGGAYSFAAANNVRATSDRGMWETLMDDATPVTSSDLAKTAEVRVTRLGGADIVYDSSMAREVQFDGERSALVFPWDARLARSIDADELSTQSEASVSTIGAGDLSPQSDQLSLAAGASPILTPQADDDSEQQPVWEQQPLRAPLVSNATLGVDHVDEEFGGIWVTADAPVMGNVFSDPRTKTVVLRDIDYAGGVEAPYLFRIASVEQGGEMRSRIVYQRVYTASVTVPQTVDFDTGIEGVPRSQLFDYDFDVVGNEQGTDIYLFIVSGMRSGDAVTPYEAFENLVFTYVHFNSRSGTIESQQSFSWLALADKVIHGVANAFICPNITHISGTGDDSLVMFSWLHRLTDKPGVSVGSSDAAVVIGAGFAYSGGIVLPNVEGHLRLTQDSSAYDMQAALGDITPSGEAFVGFVVRGERGTASAHLYVVPPQGDEPPRTRGEATHGLLLSQVNRLTPWLGHSGFLTSKDGKLVHAWIRDDTTVLHFEDVGPEGLEVNSFGIDPTGTFVYFPQNRAGVGALDYDEEGEVAQTELNDNRIVAAKLHRGVFSDPFILVHCRHSIEHVAYLYSNDAAIALITTSITDFATSVATIYITSVPAVACATVLGAVPSMPLVAAGDDLDFSLTIRNDGNLYLTGATVLFLDEAGDQVHSSYLRFGQDTLQESMWNPSREYSQESPLAIAPASAARSGEADSEQAIGTQSEAGLLNVGVDYELGPGRKAVYKTALPVPADWDGERTVSIELVEPTYEGSAAIAADAAPLRLDGVAFTETNSHLLNVTKTTGSDGGTTQDAPVTVRRKNSDGTVDEETESTTAPAAGSNASKGSAAPATGDSPFGLVAAAVGAAGLGLAAYSARRLQNEKQRAEDEGGPSGPE